MTIVTLAVASVACTPFGEAPSSGPPVEDARSSESDTPQGDLRDGGATSAADSASGSQLLIGCNGALSCERVVFVTSMKFKPKEIGGLAAADATCTMLAGFADSPRVRGREFVAWLSDDSSNALARMPKGTGSYVRPDGTRVAKDFATFTSGLSLDNPISVDEDGEDQDGSVWTGTGALGLAFGGNCSNWKTNTGVGNMGSIARSSPQWTSDTNSGLVGICPDDSARIYCFEK